MNKYTVTFFSTNVTNVEVEAKDEDEAVAHAIEAVQHCKSYLEVGLVEKVKKTRPPVE